jgi:diadenosine tetraphosphate (Ap4A) HIT family hydrolase
MFTKGYVQECPFCDFVLNGEPLAEEETCVAKYDKYPVSPGHTLLIPRRHVTTPFELSAKERRGLFKLLLKVRGVLESQFHPAGYNVGVNVGNAAGQTVMHLHVHVIPRYPGDVENPEGGVRNVIPALGPYISRADN